MGTMSPLHHLNLKPAVTILSQNQSLPHMESVHPKPPSETPKLEGALLFKLRRAAAQALHQQWAGPGQVIHRPVRLGYECVFSAELGPMQGPVMQQQGFLAQLLLHLSNAFCSILSFQEKQRSSDENQSLHGRPDGSRCQPHHCACCHVFVPDGLPCTPVPCPARCSAVEGLLLHPVVPREAALQ